MIGHRPITTEDSAGVSILFYKRWSAAPEGIPASRITPGFFLFCLQLAHRAEDHLGSIHSSHVFFTSNKKAEVISSHRVCSSNGWNLDAKYTTCTGKSAHDDCVWASCVKFQSSYLDYHNFANFGDDSYLHKEKVVALLAWWAQLHIVEAKCWQKGPY